MPYYKYKDHNIFYEDQGSGHCLFFVHEWNSSSLSFRKLNLKYLVRKLRVVCIDLPGYGNSEFVEGLQFDDFSNIIIELLNYLKIQRCTLMGFCLGSTIILNFYQKYPERVKFLILIEPVLNFPKILIPLLVPKLGVAFLKYLAKHRFFFSLVGSGLIGANKSVNTQIFKGISKNDPRISEYYLQLLFKKSNHSDFRTLNVDIQKKCLCILGQDTNLLFKKNAVSLLNHFNIQDCFILNDTRHFALLEQPVRISDIIHNYLKNVQG
jgi:pimeloyl-ACP methyl ester carboxylesterase